MTGSVKSFPYPERMADPKPRNRRAQAAPTRWLTADEEAAWRAVASVLVRLPWALECQLQRDAGLSFIEYHALAMLSETPEHTRRMSDLAAVTNASLSRLSHLVRRLEDRGLVRREADPTDGRYTNAVLTKAGHKHLVASAPAHVATVRQLVIDPFTKADLRQLHKAAERILRGV
jgi:DNA-binding MarR family transcriptional regulator